MRRLSPLSGAPAAPQDAHSAPGHAHSAPRRARSAPRMLEVLECRRFLATHIINGTAADDTWQISAAAGQVTLNGITTNNPSITDVQVNGLGGFDTLIINSGSIPILFNGGEDGDLLNVPSGQLASVTGAVTFNGNAGGDTLRIDALPGVGINGSGSFTFN